MTVVVQGIHHLTAHAIKCVPHRLSLLTYRHRMFVQKMWRHLSGGEDDRPTSAHIIDCDEDGAAELVLVPGTYTAPITTTTTKKTSSPAKTLPDEEEYEYSITGTNISSGFAFFERTMRKETKQRLAILCGVILVLIAIILGIVLGTKDKRNNNSSVQNNNNNTEQQGDNDDEPEPVNYFTNDKCGTATRMSPEGSVDIGIISEASVSTFNVQGSEMCGNATFDGGPGKWYVVSGTGQILNLHACTTNCTAPENAMISPEVSIFVGECSALYCLDGTANLMDHNPFQFESIRGQDYFIYIQGADDAVGLFEISIIEE